LRGGGEKNAAKTPRESRKDFPPDVTASHEKTEGGKGQLPKSKRKGKNLGKEESIKILQQVGCYSLRLGAARSGGNNRFINVTSLAKERRRVFALGGKSSWHEGYLKKHGGGPEVSNQSGEKITVEAFLLRAEAS